MGVRGGPTGAEGQSRERLREAENAGFRSFSKCFRRRAAGRTAYTNAVGARAPLTASPPRVLLGLCATFVTLGRWKPTKLQRMQSTAAAA